MCSAFRGMGPGDNQTYRQDAQVDAEVYAAQLRRRRSEKDPAKSRVWQRRAASSLAKARTARAPKQSYREPNARTEDGLGAHNRR